MFKNINKNIVFPKKRRYRSTNNKVFVSNVTDPIINTCIEKWLIHTHQDCEILYMWRNTPSVFIGRNQNPYKECNIQNIQLDSVALIRRESGGGAVYHDLGNTNFSFITPRDQHDRSLNYRTIIDALKCLGIDSQVKGRNDLVVQDRKISGSAYKLYKNLMIHHGTLLLNLNMSSLPRYLNPNKKKLASKDVPSIQARVTNLIDVNPNINHSMVVDAVVEQYQTSSGNIALIDSHYVDQILMNNEYFLSRYQQCMSWEWTYGHTNLFSYNIDNYFLWGMIEVGIDCDAGLIKDIRIESDSLYPNMIELITKCLIGKRFSTDGVTEANVMFRHLAETSQLADTDKCIGYIDEFCYWLKMQI